MAQLNRQQAEEIWHINLPNPKYGKGHQGGIAEDDHPRPIIAVDDLFDRQIEMRKYAHKRAYGQRNANSVKAVDQQKFKTFATWQDVSHPQATK